MLFSLAGIVAFHILTPVGTMQADNLYQQQKQELVQR